VLSTDEIQAARRLQRDQDVRYGLELRIEPLVTIADFREQTARRIAATLREWSALLNQAAASLD
jgi:hypothetical protein